MGLDIRVQRMGRRSAVGHIEDQDPAMPAEFGNLRSNGGRLVDPRAAMQYRIVAVARQAQGNRPPDAARGTGDEDGGALGHGAVGGRG